MPRPRRPCGPVTLTGIRMLPGMAAANASSVPSPPSAMGRATSSVGWIDGAPAVGERGDDIGGGDRALEAVGGEDDPHRRVTAPRYAGAARGVLPRTTTSSGSGAVPASHSSSTAARRAR